MTAIPIAIKAAVESTDKVTELLWQDALRHLESTNNEVLLPTNITDMIGQSNVDKIKSRLCALIGAPVVAFVDESINALRIMRTPAFAGSVVSVASHNIMPSVRNEVKTVGPNPHGKPLLAKVSKVPRPPNAFILYRQHHHPRAKAAYPEFHNNDISIMLGKQWKAEPEEVKAHYKALADDIKRKHAEEHPDYQYAPRRPSEKKRRASSRQFAKHRKSSTNSLPESPSSNSTIVSSSVTTPIPLNPAIIQRTRNVRLNETTTDLSSMDVVISPNEAMQDENFNFNSDAFDALIQQVQNDQNKAMLYQQFNLRDHQTTAESFNFSDFITDCY